MYKHFQNRTKTYLQIIQEGILCAEMCIQFLGPSVYIYHLVVLLLATILSEYY
jgi:hypothetical protein